MKPKRREHIQVQPLPDGSALLYDTESATAYPITESAAVAWNASDGTRSIEEIAAEVESRFEADQERIAADLAKLFEDLRSKGLLESPSQDE